MWAKNQIAAVRNELVSIAVENTQLNQPLYHDIYRNLMGSVEMLARTTQFNGRQIGGKHDIINFFLRRGIMSIDWEGARNVSSIVLVLTAGINKHKLTGS